MSTLFEPGHMMRFDLVRPCGDCPFRRDMPCDLGEENAAAIILAMFGRGDAFACHKTVEYANAGIYEGGICTENSQHCAGALILAEKAQERGIMAQEALRQGKFDPARLDMTAAVVSNAAEFLEGQDRVRGNAASTIDAA